jgi:hypothetical protein
VGSYFTYNGLNYPIVEQAPGSLTTSFSGTLATDVDLTGSTINFFGASGGTALAAAISGNWQPGIGGTQGATDPANYGGTFIFLGVNYTAIRDEVGSLPTPAPVALTPQGGGTYTFPSNQNVQIDVGNLDYDTGLFGHGRTSIIGLAGQNMAGNGTLQDNGDGTFTITVPIMTSFFSDLGGGASSTTVVNGSVTGTGSPGMSPSHGINPAVGLAQLAGTQLATGVSQPAIAADSIGTATVSSPTAVAGDASAPVQTGVASAVTSVASLAHVAAVDSVFLDPVQSSGLGF